VEGQGTLLLQKNVALSQHLLRGVSIRMDIPTQKPLDGAQDSG
jgi:hypothetical protein